MVLAAEADVRAAEADLARTASGNRREDRAAASADLAAAEARAKSSAAVAARLAQAAAGGSATPDEVERARRQAEVDRATADGAAAKRDLVTAGSRAEDIARERARTEASKARLQEAQQRLAQRTVSAPIAGEVLQLKVRAGEYYAPGGDPLLVLGDLSRIRARIDIGEREVAGLAVGAVALVRAPAHPGRDFSARVVEVARRMGRKNVRTDDPIERNDAKILEVVVFCMATVRSS